MQQQRFLSTEHFERKYSFNWVDRLLKIPLTCHAITVNFLRHGIKRLVDSICASDLSTDRKIIRLSHFYGLITCNDAVRCLIARIAQQRFISDLSLRNVNPTDVWIIYKTNVCIVIVPNSTLERRGERTIRISAGGCVPLCYVKGVQHLLSLKGSPMIATMLFMDAALSPKAEVYKYHWKWMALKSSLFRQVTRAHSKFTMSAWKRNGAAFWLSTCRVQENVSNWLVYQNWTWWISSKN